MKDSGGFPGLAEKSAEEKRDKLKRFHKKFFRRIPRFRALT